MKKSMIFLLLFTSLLFAAESKNSTNDKKKLVKQHVQKQIELEQQYAKKDTFYVDMKAAEVNPDSLASVPLLDVDDFDMDTDPVYY